MLLPYSAAFLPVAREKNQVPFPAVAGRRGQSRSCRSGSLQKGLLREELPAPAVPRWAHRGGESTPRPLTVLQTSGLELHYFSISEAHGLLGAVPFPAVTLRGEQRSAQFRPCRTPQQPVEQANSQKRGNSKHLQLDR